MRLSKVLAVAALSMTTVATARGQATSSMQRPFTLGIAAGAAIPTGDLSDGVNTGYNVAGSLGLSTPTFPIGARFEVNYSSFGVKQSIANSVGADDANTRALGFIGNLVLPVPLPNSAIRPYAIGGVGVYNTKVSASVSGITGSQSENDFGFNIGGGILIPLSGFNAFVEARYHHVSIGDNLGGGSAAFVPITFGISF